MDHALAVTETYVVLAEAQRAGAFEILAFEAEPDCWRVFSRFGATVTLKPDGFARLGYQAEEAWLFIEVDRGTESVRTIEAKAELYRAYWESSDEQDAHGVFPEVMWLTPNEARRLDVETAIERAGSSAISTTAVQQHFLELVSMSTENTL